MMTFRTMSSMQFRRLCSRNSARSALTIMLVIVIASLVESCIRFYGADASEVPSAAIGWAGNVDAMQIQTMRVFYFFLVFLIAALVFADSFYVDVKSGMANILATRSTMGCYLASTAFVSFLGGFAVIFSSLLLSQIVAFFVFPAQAAPNAFLGSINTPASDATWALLRASNALFPYLYVNHPYLDNAVFILYTSLWSGVMSLASFTVSLFSRRSRLVVLGAPTLAYLVLSYLMPPSYALSYYLYPMALREGLSQVFFFAAPLIVLIATGVAVAVATKRKKDVML